MPRSAAEITSSLARLAGRPAIFATVIIVGWLALLWSHHAPADFRTFDQPVYLATAYDLLHLHRFTDGSGWGDPHVDPTRPPGMDRTPLYSAFLAGTALLDPAFDRSLSCFVEHSDAPSCPRDAPLPRAVQFAMMVAVYLMLWRLAVRATESHRIGWLSLGVGLIAAPALIGSFDELMTETVTLFFVTGATATAVEAAKARQPTGWLLLSGAMIGLAAMTRPAFVYLLPMSALVGVCIAVWRPRRWRGMTLVAAFLLGGAVVIGPWIVRNTIVLSRPACCRVRA